MKRTGFSKKIEWNAVVYAAYGLMMAAIVAICLFLSWILYAKKRETLPNLLLLPAGLCIIAGVHFIAGHIAKRIKGFGKRRMLIGSSLFFLLMQIVMVSQYYFYTDWDVETLVECAMAAVTGADISRHSNYFSMYPNNLVLVTLFGWVIRGAYLLGMGEHAYFALLVFQCVICWIAGLLLCAVVDGLLHNDAWTVAAYVIYQMLIGCSPWISIPYSDAVALFFPIAIIAVYTLVPKTGIKGILRLGLIAFLSYFGYRIKPQIMIVLIALGLYHGVAWFVRKDKKPLHAGEEIRKAGGFAVGLMCAVLLANSMAAQVDVTVDSNKTFGVAHFLMMGMNPEEFGVYAQRDVSFSWRCETQAERTAANLEVLGQRLCEMGPIGLFKQVMRKTLTNFNDGTFCWAGEGVFYREILKEKNSILSPLLRNIYYSEQGVLYPAWANLAQAVWLGVMALAACACLNKKDDKIAVIMLAIIGLTIFETLFEARARYLFCFVPLYIILAATGIAKLSTLIGKHKMN